MTPVPTKVAIALGSNRGDRFELLRSAAAAVAGVDEVRILAASTIEETEPIGPAQPAFLNQMLLVETTLPLPALLGRLQVIEAAHGRERTLAKGPRTLDLDIVWAEQVTITTADLLVPHPGVNDRDFWQRELAELLGIDAAADAIAAARVHAGKDTGVGA